MQEFTRKSDPNVVDHLDEKKKSSDPVVSSTEIVKIESSKEIYEFHEKLGKGSFGRVYKATYKPTGEILAVKVIFLLFYLLIDL